MSDEDNKALTHTHTSIDCLQLVIIQCDSPEERNLLQPVCNEAVAEIETKGRQANCRSQES